jgi:drug/metabolite transporter (DMT)-like permease
MLVAFSNKALLANFGFKYPFLLTLLHMLTCTCSCVIMGGLGKMWAVARIQRSSTWAQLRKIGMLSVVFCSTVVFGNISLRYIPVSFNQAVSATTPAFTAVLTYVLQSKVESVTTYATLVPVVVGIVIASRFEPSFHLWCVSDARVSLYCRLPHQMRAPVPITPAVAERS